ncbi:DNA-directed RNA polymerase subunit omega [Clostridium niameyense]|uniref:DNA-directed RNA polymerase subunit omega n=1 Tax=Clostridium niameyense TaxID=1622073 RepID=A0A6M0R714_9CLOT|nr:DNA-directed RNA polymerase subunit omega [Clostridium niameyense]NEZ46005.1 DNA-directed RNA polymerase subunit omega [Clostridium niameyense]
MSSSMINPSIVDLMEKVDNRYALIVITSKRARQIIDGKEPLVDMDSTKPVTLAINEINEGKISYKTLKEGIK